MEKIIKFKQENLTCICIYMGAKIKSLPNLKIDLYDEKNNKN